MVDVPTNESAGTFDSRLSIPNIVARVNVIDPDVPGSVLRGAIEVKEHLSEKKREGFLILSTALTHWLIKSPRAYSISPPMS